MAVARTTADYIVRLDADDSISPLYVEILLAAVRAAKATFAYSDMLYVGDRSFGGPPEVFRAKPFSVWSLMRMNYVNASAMVGRRAFLDVGGYREPNADAEDVFHEDWDLWLRLAALGHRGVHVRRPLLFYRQHEFGNRSHAWRHPDTIGRLVTAMQRQNPRLYRKVGYRLSSRQPFANILTRITNDPAPSVARLIDATVLAF